MTGDESFAPIAFLTSSLLSAYFLSTLCLISCIGNYISIDEPGPAKEYFFKKKVLM